MFHRLGRDRSSGDQLRQPAFTWAKYEEPVCDLLIPSEGSVLTSFLLSSRALELGAALRNALYLHLLRSLTFSPLSLMPHLSHVTFLSPSFASGPRLTLPLVSGDGRWHWLEELPRSPGASQPGVEFGSAGLWLWL